MLVGRLTELLSAKERIKVHHVPSDKDARVLKDPVLSVLSNITLVS